MKSTKDYLEYKGYIGKIHYSQEDEVFFGTIFGIDDLVTFEGESVHELKNAFEEAVDSYLEMCEEIGKEPDKTYRGLFNVRIDPELHKQIAMEAVKRGISLNQFVETALKEYINQLEQETGSFDNTAETLSALAAKFQMEKYWELLQVYFDSGNKYIISESDIAKEAYSCNN